MADKIIYTLEVDDKNFTAVVRNANGEVVQLDKLIKKTGDDGSKSFEKMTEKVRDLSLAYSGVKDAISTVANTFKSFIAESENARKASSQLDLALKNINAESMGQGIKNLADSLEDAGIQEADAAIKAAALGVQMGISSDKIKDATTGAIGLSKSYNIDLDGAMKLVAGGMQGNYDMLARLNPAMRAAGTEAEKAAIFQKMLADGFKFAESEGKTFSGEMERLQNKIGNVKEAIGGFLIKVILPLAQALSENMPLAIGVVSGALVGMIVPVYTLVTAVSALGTAVTAATGGLNLLIAAGAALTIGGIAYVATMDDGTESTGSNTTATEKNKKAKEDLAKTTADLADNTDKLNKLLDEANKNDLEDERITKARAARDEYFKLTEDRIGMLSKELAAKKITAEQWNAEYDKILELEDVFNQKLSDAYDTVNADKIAKDSEAAAKLFEEAEKRREKQRKLDDEIFVENQELSRKETEEQKKRVDEYNALQISKRDTAIKASEDVMQAEMDVYTEQYENQKAHNDAMTQLNNDYAVAILGGLELIQYQNQAAYDADIQAYRDLLEQKKVSNDEYVEYITKRTGKLNNDQTKAAMQAGKQGLKQMETDLKAASALGKDFAKVAKVISIANTTISSIEASIQAYKAMAGIPVIGPALGIAASAAALLAGAGAVAKITSTSTGFRDGGHTGYGNRDDVAGVVHNEEFVNTAETVDRVGIPALEALEDGRATIVPIASVSKPDAFTGSANTEYIARSVQALSMNITNEAGNGTTETVVINNSDFVTVTKKIEQTKNKYKSVSNNKLITEY